MSSHLQDDEIPKIGSYLSSERLAAFHAIAGSDRDAIELHQKVLNVGAALAPVVALIEIAIRNTVSEKLRTAFGTPDWLRNPPPPFAWGSEQSSAIRTAVKHAQRAAYAKLSNIDKRALEQIAYADGIPAGLTHEERVKGRQRAISVGHGQVIAQLTLYFWKRLFSEDYEETLWKRSLKSVFPNKTLSRTQIADVLETIYQARNRIAHHEPIYDARLTRLLEAIDFTCQNFDVRRPSVDTPLAKLVAPFRERLELAIAELTVELDSYRSPVGNDREDPERRS